MQPRSVTEHTDRVQSRDRKGAVIAGSRPRAPHPFLLCHLACLPLLALLTGCGGSIAGHWHMVDAVPNKEVFSIDDATFARDGNYTATTTLEGKTTKETGTYRFSGFKIIFQPQAGGRRAYNATRKLGGGRLVIFDTDRRVVLEKDN